MDGEGGCHTRNPQVAGSIPVGVLLDINHGQLFAALFRYLQAV